MTCAPHGMLDARIANGRLCVGIAVLATVLSLVGCNRDDASPTDAPKQGALNKAAALPKKGPSAEELTAGMTEASTQGKSPLMVNLKFEVTDHPKVGSPVEINLALISQMEGTLTSVQVSSAEGFDAAAGALHYDIGDIEVGEVYRHIMKVTPGVEGVAFIALAVTSKHDDQIATKSFTVPLIVAR